MDPGAWLSSLDIQYTEHFGLELKLHLYFEFLNNDFLSFVRWFTLDR